MLQKHALRLSSVITQSSGVQAVPGPEGTVHWGTAWCVECLASCCLIMDHAALRRSKRVYEGTSALFNSLEIQQGANYQHHRVHIVSTVSLCGECIHQQAELLPISCRSSLRRPVCSCGPRQIAHRSQSSNDSPHWQEQQQATGLGRGSTCQDVVSGSCQG